MSSIILAAADLEKMRKEEEERRQMFQELVRIRDGLQRRTDTIKAINLTLVPVCDQVIATGYAQSLSEISLRSEKCLGEIKRVLISGSRNSLKKTLSTVSEEYAEDEKMIRLIEEQATNLHKHYVEEKLREYITTNNKERIAETNSVILDELVESEIQRLEKLLVNLEERAKNVHISSSEVEKIRCELQEKVAGFKSNKYSLLENIHNTDLFRIRTLRDVIEKKERELDILDEKLSAELSKYHVLCSEALIQPKMFSFKHESIEEIRYECGRLIEQKEKNQTDLRMIMRKIRESLSNNGYRYIGESKENRHIVREAYRIHDNNILHVVYDSTGRVTMEVSIEDCIDRSPYMREAEMLVNEQRHFCDDYERIFSLINQNVLALRTEKKYPCSADYATVINISEFRSGEEPVADVFYEQYYDRNKKYLEEELI